MNPLAVADDSAETPGRCIRAKNLTPCSTRDDCSGVGETCAPLNDAQGQTYCLPTSKDNEGDLEQLVPGQHQAYSRQLAVYGTSMVLIIVANFVWNSSRAYTTRTEISQRLMFGCMNVIKFNWNLR